jgi:Na+/H+ antiporter NhaC
VLWTHHFVFFHESLLFVAGIFILTETINKSGGTNGCLKLLSTCTSRADVAQVILFMFGVITFFDSYASILILGKVIGSVMKGFPLSEEKLAFLVDTTGLPVSSIILGSSWFVWTAALLRSEVLLIGGNQGDIDYEDVLASSIKYQFYQVLILALTFLQQLSSRESGPILQRENNARSEYGKSESAMERVISISRREATRPEISSNWWLPVIMLNILLWAAFIRLEQEMELDERDYFSAWMTCTAGTVIMAQSFFILQSLKIPSLSRLAWWQRRRDGLAFLTETFPSGSASIPYASTSKSDDLEHDIDQDFREINGNPKVEGTQETRPQTSCFWKDDPIMTTSETVDCIFEGINCAIPFLVTQTLAWSVCEVYLGLGIDRVFVACLLDDRLSTETLPIAGLLVSFLLSVLLGSSQIAVSIMIPAISQSLALFLGNEKNNFIILLGSILSGAVAGDHIGPFSDTTILSGLSTGCGVRKHFLTQLPYTLPVFILSILAGTLPVAYGAFTELFGFFIGVFLTCVFVIGVCRKVEKPRLLPGSSGGAITPELHPLHKGENRSSDHKQLPDEMIIPVNTADLIDRREDQTLCEDGAPVSSDTGRLDDKTRIATVPKCNVRSFESELEEINCGSGDPFLRLVEDGLLRNKTLKNSARQKRGNTQKSVHQIIGNGSNETTLENKNQLIGSTITNPEKDCNIFSESLRMFLRTAETKLDEIMTDGRIDIQASQSAESGDDDSLDNLMMDIAAKRWKPAVNSASMGNDVNTGVTRTGEGCLNGGSHISDGIGSEVESIDYDSDSTTSSMVEDTQSTAFTSLNEDSDSNGSNSTTGTSHGRSLIPSPDATPKIDSGRVDQSVLMNPLAFHKSHNLLVWMGGHKVSSDEVKADRESTKYYSKASF